MSDTKLCKCGCGLPAPIAKRGDKRHGHIKGQPVDFVRGHHIRNNQAPWYKGDVVGYRALHTYLSRHFPKTGTCEECGGTAKRTEYALIKGRVYTRDRADYRELCKRCHNAYDEVGGSRWRKPGAPMTARRRAAQARTGASDCACGCGIQVGWDSKHARWRRYMPGHYQPADHLNRAQVA